jgi:hypothetical protein
MDHLYRSQLGMTTRSITLLEPAGAVVALWNVSAARYFFLVSPFMPLDFLSLGQTIFKKPQMHTFRGCATCEGCVAN